MGFHTHCCDISHSELLTLHVTSHSHLSIQHQDTQFRILLYKTNRKMTKPRGAIIGNTPTCDLTGRIL